MKLETQLKRAKLMTAWKTFAAFAKEYLGMPFEAMPFFDIRCMKNDVRWRKKAELIKDFVMMSGNFGHNRDSSYRTKYPYLIRKAFSMKRRVCDIVCHARIFPLDTFWFFPRILYNGLRSAAKGE